MRGLETEGQSALHIAIEDDAAPLELGDRRRGRRRDARGDRRVGEPIAGGERVGGMQCGRIVLAQRGRDTALCPGAGSALGERRLGEKDHLLRRQVERGHEAGEAAADDDRPAAEIGGELIHHPPPRQIASMRSTARRAGAATEGSIVTS
jgi:hypothetical protein